jgi:hypothetical protein
MTIKGNDSNRNLNSKSKNKGGDTKQKASRVKRIKRLSSNNVYRRLFENVHPADSCGTKS